MSGKQDKSFDDVGSLVNQLDLGGMRYREFGGSRTPAEQKPAVAVSEPAKPMARPAPAEAAQPPATQDATRLRSASAGSPLAFTFERLRRQSIGSNVRAPVLVLNLPERHAVHADRQAQVARSLREIFSALDAEPRRRSGG